MGDKRQSSSQPHQRTPSLSSYLTWFFSRHYFFFRDPPLVLMKDGTVVKIYATADGQDSQVVMPMTKCDTAISRSVISKRNADASGGTTEELSPPQVLTDSSGRTYQSHGTIILRCAVDQAAQTFGETFYIVEDCGEYDAILRKGSGTTAP